MAHNSPFTKDQVAEAFKKMPTFSDDAIDVADMEPFLKALGFDCNKEQRDAYVTFFREVYNGKLPLEVCTTSLAAVNDTIEILKVFVKAMDKDKDGFIDESEFKAIFPFLLTHDPSFPRVEFANFVTEADTNKDGKVSIDEAVEWFCKNAKN
ncbi:Calmodulin-like protein 5 [Folsomia candida]|uniref:Calmodulin-like protein 5 n=1 Tax=Folsomia candida TaxID=158441 RepID=A0A226DYC5_FOLCA|nr:Calmodulin-like protein 5 [Folsomia candida]